jgi:hypothetical protein
MNFKLWLEQNQSEEIWYHGRTVDSPIFSLDYVGREEALDQEGPGFYFTNDLENAKKYAEYKGIVLVCKMNYSKRLLNDRSKPNKKVIEYLIRNSPEFNDEYGPLTDFDENPKVAFNQAVANHLRYPQAKDAYQILANTFYKYNPKEYLINLSKFFDGHIALRQPGWFHDTLIKHLIVYNPNIIQVVNKIQL